MRSAFAAALLAGSILATPALAGVLVVTGDTTGKPTWNRPIAGNPPVPPLSGVGTNVPYEVTEFTVTANGVYDFLNIGTNPVNWDNYLFLYQTAFNPATPFVNILIGNDDFPNIGRSGFSYGLLAGVTYVAVTTGFANTHFGQWEMTIRGPGDILLAGGGVIPEPGTWAMMIAGFGLVGAGLRRRRAAALTA